MHPFILQGLKYVIFGLFTLPYIPNLAMITGISRTEFEQKAIRSGIWSLLWYHFYQRLSLMLDHRTVM